MQDSERRYSRRRRPQDDGDAREILSKDEGYSDDGVTPPPGGTKYAIVAGLIGGVLGAVLSIAITYLNSPLYQQATRESRTGAASSLDYALTGLFCLNIIFNLLICFLTGYFTGKRAVRRIRGFLAGAIAGVVMVLGGFITNLIPGYPGTLTSQTNLAAFSLGILTSFMLLIIAFFIDGLMGLWGASRATRNHPYYTKDAE
jgi:uncharacterized membrane protein YeaQ/YmgE (transglycosylase-associated protein family)